MHDSTPPLVDDVVLVESSVVEPVVTSPVVSPVVGTPVVGPVGSAVPPVELDPVDVLVVSVAVSLPGLSPHPAVVRPVQAIALETRE